MSEETNTTPEPKKPAPICAVTIYCMDERTHVVEQLKSAVEYLQSLTDAEFLDENKKHESGKCIIKIVDLKP